MLNPIAKVDVARLRIEANIQGNVAVTKDKKVTGFLAVFAPGILGQPLFIVAQKDGVFLARDQLVFHR